MHAARRFGRRLFLGTIFAVLLQGILAPAHAQKAERPLYDRLGGVYPIAVVVDEFINRLVVNDVLNRNPAILAARDLVPGPGLKYHVTALVCSVTGGPCAYTGRGMRESHAHLNITNEEWDEMIRVFEEVLHHFDVPRREQQELIAIVESTKGEIVRPHR